MKRISTYLLFFLLLFSSQSWAFWLEPGIGYNRGHYQTSKAQGIGLGLKLGFEIGSSLLIGADVGYHDLQLGSTPTSTATNMGLALGGKFQGWKFWYTYLASASLAIPNGDNQDLYTGKGFKLGIGGKLGGSAWLNLETRFIDYSKYQPGDGTDATPITQFYDGAFIYISWD